MANENPQVSVQFGGGDVQAGMRRGLRRIAVEVVDAGIEWSDLSARPKEDVGVEVFNKLRKAPLCLEVNAPCVQW